MSDSRQPGRVERLADAARKLNRHPTLLQAARRTREWTIGEEPIDDVLAGTRRRATDIAVRHLAALQSDSPGLMGELSVTMLGTWQRIAEAQGRGRGEVDVAILFTDLVGFSSWALESGDELAINLLREVSEAIEPPIVRRRGVVVKRLGDGLMSVFRDATSAAEAAFDARERTASIELDSYRPRLRTGIHLGRPRKIGGDYFGVDVNIAARLAEAAQPDEILVSDRTLQALDRADIAASERPFSAKGAPADLAAHALSRAPRQASETRVDSGDG